MKLKLAIQCCAALLLLAACSNSEPQSQGAIDKTAIFQGGKFDSTLEARVCREAGLPEGCDVCDAKGYYGDGECDSFCPQPDSDCTASCQSDADCPTIFCITTPCPQFACRSGQCVQNTGCEPLDATGTGVCELFFGFAWNGAACVGVGGCKCEGADCDKLFGTATECEDAHATCLTQAPCAAQDVVPHGPCEAIVGVFWDGSQCNYQSGCSCTGTDCQNGYIDVPTCEAEHSACNQGDGCVVGGCSGQLCTDAKNGPAISTCEYREEYACYQDAFCERQVDGTCGWTQTADLTACLNGTTCPSIAPPRKDFCGELGPLPTPIKDKNGCVTGYNCEVTTDCRTDGCDAGKDCSWCWGNYACIPHGAVC